MLVGCSVHSNRPGNKSEDEQLVSVPVALDQAQMSYLRGCVEAEKARIPNEHVFVKCRERAKLHRKELGEIMAQDLSSSEDQPTP